MSTFSDRFEAINNYRDSVWETAKSLDAQKKIYIGWIKSEFENALDLPITSSKDATSAVKLACVMSSKDADPPSNHGIMVFTADIFLPMR